MDRRYLICDREVSDFLILTPLLLFKCMIKDFTNNLL